LVISDTASEAAGWRLGAAGGGYGAIIISLSSWRMGGVRSLLFREPQPAGRKADLPAADQLAIRTAKPRSGDGHVCDQRSTELDGKRSTVGLVCFFFWRAHHSRFRNCLLPPLSLGEPRNFEAEEMTESVENDPNLERLGACLGLVFGIGLSIKNGLKGWANIYLKEFHKEGYYEAIYWNYVGTLMLICLAAMAIWLFIRPLPRRFRGDVFPHAFGLIWFVLLTQHAIPYS